MNRCRGCGIVLQSNDPTELGYTRHLEDLVCERCFRLKHYGEYQEVILGNREYQKILARIPRDRLVLYVTDIFSLEMDGIENFSRVLVVVTKRDVMPKSIRDDRVCDYVKKRYGNVLDVVVVSSIKNYGMDLLYRLILKYSHDKEVYVVGNTNSGKSTLINQLVHDYGEGESGVTVSMYPSTTLDMVKIALLDATLVDTPGLIHEGNIVHFLKGADLKKVMPRKEVKPRSCQVNGRGSILIGDYARMDYDSDGKNSFVVYTSNMVMVRFMSIKKNTYRDWKCFQYSLANNQDIVIPGLGFIKFGRGMRVSLYLPDGVECYVRDNLI